MHIVLLIDKINQLPVGAVEVLKVGFEKRLDENYPGTTLTVRRDRIDELSVTGGTSQDKEWILVMLSNLWESSDVWYQPHQ
jgi:hypothetical protein